MCFCGGLKRAAVVAAVALLLVACGAGTDGSDRDQAATTQTVVTADTTSAAAETAVTSGVVPSATTEGAATPTTAAVTVGDSEPEDSAQTEDESAAAEESLSDDESDIEQQRRAREESEAREQAQADADDRSDDESGDTDESSPENAVTGDGEESDGPEVDDPPNRVTETSNVARVLTLLDGLAVANEIDGGYERELFKHWVDADGDGCDARREVLIAEAVVAPSVGSRCSLSDGEWLSRYDGKTTSGNGSSFDVDHMVPLAEAWESGAHDWTADRREQYANDLGYADSLVAVSAASNRSKGARDPAEWMPPTAGVHCWYAAAWVQVKTRWSLTVDQAEADKLGSVLSGCDGDDLDDLPEAQSVPDDTEPDGSASDEDTEAGGGEEDETPEQDEEAAAEEAQAEPEPDDDCHPAYEPCLPNRPGDALNCGDLTKDQRPVRIKEFGVDPYRLDRDNDGWGCTS